MTWKPAQTLVELVLVFGMVAILSTGFCLSFYNFRQKQALAASSQDLAITLRRAHIYAREEKDETGWGVRSLDEETYLLVSGSPSTQREQERYRLSRPVLFETGPFEVWFDRVTGETDKKITITLVTPSDRHSTVEVNKAGVVTLY